MVRCSRGCLGLKELCCLGKGVRILGCLGSDLVVLVVVSFGCRCGGGLI